MASEKSSSPSTGNRQQSSARERAATGVTAEQVLDDPYMFIGTIGQMVETLQRRREQYGISYLHVPFQDIDVFAPVVARLAGK